MKVMSYAAGRILVAALLIATVARADVVLPERDPTANSSASRLLAVVRGQHPRLLFTERDLPRLRAYYQSEPAVLWRRKLEAALPVCVAPETPKFLNDATDGQRQGLWRLPTVALHYVLTGDQESRRRAEGFLRLLLSLPDWETGGECNSGMSAANIMVGAALAYDWLYHDLEPEFRTRFREKLFRQARLMYYGGHLYGNSGVPKYWQQDPGNNHRWIRNAGLLLALLSSNESKPEEAWLLEQAIKDVEFVCRWLPYDGTSHEGAGYLIFGQNHLLLTVDASDRCLGSRLLAADYFKNVGVHRVHLLRPGFHDAFPLGDTTPGMTLAFYNNFGLKTASAHRQPAVKDAFLRLAEKSPEAMEHAWFSLLWDDPSLPRGEMASLPTASFWPDIGLATVRGSWDDSAVAAIFKCGPFGGYALNRYSEGGKNYINVAHDDPDANSFLIAVGGELLAETDGYSRRKASHNHNTILINGAGQMVKGQPEGRSWSQPAGDMSKMAVVTAYRDAGGIVAVEGEAAGSYLDYTDPKSGRSRPSLERFRRFFIWVKNDYILVLDDVRAPIPVEIDWLMQGPDLTILSEREGRFALRAGEEVCEFQMQASQPLQYALRGSPADTKGKSLEHRQLVASAKTEALRVVSVYDPWRQEKLRVTLEQSSPQEAKVVVEGSDFRDAWNWAPGAGPFEGSTLLARRERGRSAAFPFALDASNAQPPAP